MAMSPEELEAILREYGPEMRGPPGYAPDPVHPMSRYRGLPKSPDLPSARDQRLMQDNPTDMMLQDYVDRFGWERMTNPAGPPRGYVPVPRPRYPEQDPNNPLGPLRMEPEEIRGTLRTQDMDRMIREGLSEEELRMLEQQELTPRDWEDYGR